MKFVDFKEEETIVLIQQLVDFLLQDQDNCFPNS